MVSEGKNLFSIFGLFLMCASTLASTALPNGFVELSSIAPTITEEIRYATPHNFTGKAIRGYHAAICILTVPAARALANVQTALQAFGLGLKVFDCYRPQQAVDDFVAWSNDPHTQQMRAEFYPNLDKAELFKQGYIALNSGHSRGSTVDLTLVALPGSGQRELAMGTAYDYLDPLSHPNNLAIPSNARAHRLLLRTLMVDHGFNPLPTEWWHFTLADEPYPNQYFNFPIQ